MSLGEMEDTLSSGTNGWLTASPLEMYSSLHELSLAGLLGLHHDWLHKHFFLQLSFNVKTPLQIDPRACVTMHVRRSDQPSSMPHPSFTITQLKRWRLDISTYSSFEDYYSSLIRWHRCNYLNSQKNFKKYGCEVSIIEGDWSEYAETVYRLYSNVAEKHYNRLYELNFFQIAAKRDDYKLICAWFEGEMIGMFVLQEELPTLHSICCGFQYVHSSKCYAYSWLHYELIRYAIETKKYHTVDVGMTADESKRMIGFKPISCCMDVYAKSSILHGFFRAASMFITARITPDSQLKYGFRWPFHSEDALPALSETT